MNIRCNVEPFAVHLDVAPQEEALSEDGLWISAHLCHDSALFARAWSIYNGSFVDFERRSLFEQMAVMRLPSYTFRAIMTKGQVVGVLGLWQFEGFSFIEHLAVAPEQRCGGVGRLTMQGVQRTLSSAVVLDVEPFGKSHEAARRVAFYQRLGFHYCAKTVTLPPYDGKLTEPSNLMAWPLPLDQVGREAVVATIEREVYGVSPQLPRRRAG